MEGGRDVNERRGRGGRQAHTRNEGGLKEANRKRQERDKKRNKVFDTKKGLTWSGQGKERNWRGGRNIRWMGSERRGFMGDYI